MPAKVVKRGKRWAIVNAKTGKTYGSSASRSKAQSSANAINATEHGWKPTGRRRGR